MTYTKQEAFNTSYLGVIGQGGFSRDDDACMYRGPNGLKCGIGWLIDDETAKGIEGKGIDRLPDVIAKIGLSDGFLLQLQFAHDHARDMPDYRRRMADIASEHNLTIPEVTK